MNKTLSITTNKLPVVTDGLQSYFQQVNAIPFLSQEEEFELATRYKNDGDLLAAQQLVLSHLRYVVRVARLYNGYGLALADLIQEGSIGLMKAVKRFDPSMGVRLVSFAVHWIKSEIHEFVIRNWRIVKVATTKAQRKLFFNLRQSKKRLGWFSKQEVEAVAQDLGVPASEVLEMEKRLNAYDASFDASNESEDEEVAHLSPAYYLEAPHSSEPTEIIVADAQERTQAHLAKALSGLDPRSQDIIYERFLSEPKASLQTLADKHNVSIERIRQIEKATLEKLRYSIDQGDWH